MASRCHWFRGGQLSGISQWVSGQLPPPSPYNWPQDNCPPRQLPPRQLPPWQSPSPDNAPPPEDNCTPNDCPPPGQLPPDDCPWTIAPQLIALRMIPPDNSACLPNCVTKHHKSMWEMFTSCALMGRHNPPDVQSWPWSHCFSVSLSTTLNPTCFEPGVQMAPHLDVRMYCHLTYFWSIKLRTLKNSEV
jgi:hypothetical protein